MVLLQYVDSFSSHDLVKFLKSLDKKEDKHNQYRFAYADEEKGLELSGFEHNGISPIAMKHPIPVVLSDRILKLDPGIFWLGGGNLNIKGRCNPTEFVEKTGCLVASITKTG